MSLPSTKVTTTTATHAVVQAVETYIQNQNLLGEIAELDELLYDLIDLHKDNELALKRVVLCIYNLLQSNNKWNVKFGSKVFYKLISVAIADSRDDVDVSPRSLRCQLVANVLFCVQVHARKFPRIDGMFLLRQLWSLSLSSERQPHAAQILVQLFDDFVRELGEECACSIELYAVIQTLLQSKVREYRKSAHFLMRKLQIIMQTENGESTSELGTRVLETLKCAEPLWSAYVVIMETLEEQQSHLVLPTLHTLLPRLMPGNQDEDWLVWLRILYARLLLDNNILVLRWTLSYFFSHFNVNKLCRLNLLPEFLAATNRTQLYNVECQTVPEFEMEKFMCQDELELFLNAVVTVPWQSVPLHFWLCKIKEELSLSTILINKNLLLKLSSRVRTLKNSNLREDARKLLFYLFDDTIDSLTLGDYMTFVETLCNVNDHYDDYQRLITKMQNCKNIEYFNKRGYEILASDSNNLVYEDNSNFVRQLSKLPKSKHGWIRFFPLRFREFRVVLEFYKEHYDVNVEYLEKGTIAEIQQHLMKQLNCQTKEEKSLVLQLSVDWFVRYKLKTWEQLEDLQLQPIDLLESGTKATINHLVYLLYDHKKPVKDNTAVLAAFLAWLKNHQNETAFGIWHIIEHAESTLNEEESTKLVSDLIQNSRDTLLTIRIVHFAKKISNSSVVKGILGGEVSTGDARIEAAYASKELDYDDDNDAKLREAYIEFVVLQTDARVSAICSELHRINTELTEKKPRYFENCKEHRIKIRIARALLKLGFANIVKWSDDMWKSVLALNDQLNISFMYECLVAVLLPSVDLLIDQMQSLPSLKSSQQVSIISVAHIYCVRKWDSLTFEHLEKVVTLLLPHTMGAHFQTRLLAQLVLHRLALKCKDTSIEMPLLKAVNDGIETTLGSKLQELKNEARLLLPEILEMHGSNSADAILHMTNTPFDEYCNESFDRYYLSEHIEFSRAAFQLKKKTQSTPIPEVLIDKANSNVQRKMNPVNNIFCDVDFAETNGKKHKNEIIVVASLIDKLPNLGGLARTCEVFGVETLVLGAKSQAEKSDFTNLSMTAEKTLNIVEVKPAVLAEFLLEKQSMGYKIVGAEQTAHSVGFENFQFPKKCILLLGHEKHGIPVDLIALLDFAVEIPQVGVVRSLNVHVTGSLFIWEYCKQHLKK